MKTCIETSPSSYKTQSLPRRHLIDTLGRLQFGRIEGLSIINTEPQFDPPPVVIQTLKLPAQSDTHTPCAADFTLKVQFLELFRFFDLRQNVLITRLEFKSGLPVLVEAATDAAAEAAVRTE
ncbi:MAG TPA: hypothetical protein VGG72_20410 [Bryobacteraceae bacterium]|jgi:hypothetical protein